MAMTNLVNSAFVSDPMTSHCFQSKHPLAILWLAVVLAGCSPTAQPPAQTPTKITSPPPLTAPAHLKESSNSAESKVASDNDLTDLLRLIRQRLDLMPGVAQAKWNRQLPITDAQREAALLARVASEGATLGLPESDVRKFFQAQITAAKLIQEQLFKEWKSHRQQPFADAPDLERDVRPKIDELNRQLLTKLAKCWTARSRADWKEKLDSAKAAVFHSSNGSNEVMDAALRPLRK